MSLACLNSRAHYKLALSLNAQPAANVTIAISTDDPTEASIAPTVLSFSPNSWNSQQYITVTGLDDTDLDGIQEYTIVISPASSVDLQFNGVDPDDLVLTNLDNDSIKPESIFRVLPRESEVGVFLDQDIHIGSSAPFVFDLASANLAFSIDPPLGQNMYLRRFADQADSLLTIELHDMLPNTVYTVTFTTDLKLGNVPITKPWMWQFVTGFEREFDLPNSMPRPSFTMTNRYPPLTYDVTWNAIAGAVSYELQEMSSEVFADEPTIYTSSDPSVTIIRSGSNWYRYYYRVRAFDGYTYSDWSRIAFLEPSDRPALPQLAQWGAQGSAIGEFDSPRDIAVDAEGNVYIADTNNNRIQKFTSDGSHLLSIETAASGNGVFTHPWSVAIDSDNNIFFVANSSIFKYADDGAYITDFASGGSGGGSGSGSIAIAASGSLFYLNINDNIVNRFTSSDGTNYSLAASWGSPGANTGQFNLGYGANIEIDSQGNVYVSDYGNTRVQKFAQDGTYLQSFIGLYQAYINVAIDINDRVFVLDSYENRIFVYNQLGQAVGVGGRRGSDEGQFMYPTALATDVDGCVYVLDFNNYLVTSSNARIIKVLSP
jgi:sugar lactone lactonase YvrE